MNIKNNSNKIYTGLLTSGLTLFSLSTFAATCQNPVPVWADEFDGSSLDTSKWDIQTGDGCAEGTCGWGNAELQSYQAANNTVANGVLTITAKKQRVQSKNYTSGRIRTANVPNGGQWTHGRFEASIKLPDGSGMWPGFWMLPTDAAETWPISGEIDIVESTGTADMIAFGTIHYGQLWPDNEHTGGGILKQPDTWSADFHEYAVEWEPNEIRWYLDDILYSVKTPADLSDSSYWTFENYQYHLILNMAVGGSLGGAVDDSALPQTMEVDYVRVYDFGQPSLTGEHLVLPNSSATYSVVDEAGTGSSYSWTSPTGETSNNSSLTVNWGTTSGPVSVAVTNSCGTSNISMDVYVAPEISQEAIFDDFEANRNLTYTSMNGTMTESVTNPAADAINSSTIVAQYVRDSASQWDAILADTTLVTDAAAFVAGSKAFYLDVYTSAPIGTEILVQLENSNVATAANFPSGRHSKYAAYTTSTNAWQRLRFQMTDLLDGSTASTDVNQVVLLLDPNNFTGHTYYLDNFDIYGGDGGNGGGETATHISIASIVTSTVGAGKGQKFGQATITVVDNIGNPIAGANVSGLFSGTWNEAASGITDSNGVVEFLTASSVGGGVVVNFCVDALSGSLPHDSTASTGLCQ